MSLKLLEHFRFYFCVKKSLCLVEIHSEREIWFGDITITLPKMGVPVHVGWHENFTRPGEKCGEKQKVYCECIKCTFCTHL